MIVMGTKVQAVEEATFSSVGLHSFDGKPVRWTLQFMLPDYSTLLVGLRNTDQIDNMIARLNNARETILVREKLAREAAQAFDPDAVM